ncbi:MAG: hypothetical protein QHC79_18860 [Pseudosphingobacterium sp.]|nr:hypothetical protein [Pseudosphingobacterium sp.]
MGSLRGKRTNGGDKKTGKKDCSGNAQTSCGSTGPQGSRPSRWSCAGGQSGDCSATGQGRPHHGSKNAPNRGADSQ